MEDKKIPSFELSPEFDQSPFLLRKQPTQSIDLHGLFTTDVTESGSFDIRGQIWTTTFGKLMQALPIPAVLLCSNRRVIATNDAWQGIFGTTTDESVDFEKNFSTPRNMIPVRDVLLEVLRTRKPGSTQAMAKPNNTRIWARLTFRCIRMLQERFVLALVENLTAEKRQIALQKKHAVRLAEEIDRRKNAEQALKRSHDLLEERVIERTAELMKSNEELKREISVREKAEKRLEYLAHYDPLTGLANRVLFRDRLAQAITRAKRSEKHVGVVLLDLDNFKDVNDAFGHPFGDRLIRAVGERLTTCVREMDTVGRLGGDEFIVILPDLEEKRTAIMVADRIIQSVSKPLMINGREIAVSTSMGITFFPSDGNDTDRLLQNADIALYRAKNLGRQNYKFFSEEMNRELMERTELETALKTALENKELHLFLQPIMSFETGHIIGAEMLLRWKRPGKGWVPVEKIIQIAEETGLIVPIGEWALHETCGRIQEWKRMGLGPICLSLNVSGVQLNRPGFVNRLEEIIRQSGCDSTLLQIEITETAAMKDLKKTMDAFQFISANGLRVAIDDFGTGYSSLSYLKELPIHKLKIDKSFVQGIDTDPPPSEIKPSFSAIITMAHSLGLKTVAEGVETRAQLGRLWALGCDEWQGFYFNKPLPKEEFIPLLRKEVKAETVNCRWTEDMSLNVETIDNQHRELCCHINNLNRSIWNGADPCVLREFVNFLHDYVRLHFNDEQRLMEEFRYDDMQKHMDEHRVLTDRVMAVKSALQSNEATGDHLLQYLTELQELFRVHVTSVDGSFADFIRQNPINISHNPQGVNDNVHY